MEGNPELDRDPSRYRELLLAALQKNEWTTARQLVYWANYGLTDVEPVTIDILLRALREEQSTVIERLTMMHVATRRNLKDGLTVDNALTAWGYVNHLLHSGVPTEVRDYLTRTCSKHKLISLLAVELTKSPESRIWLINVMNAREVFFCKLVRGDSGCQKIAASIISEVGSTKPSDEPLSVYGLSQVHMLFEKTKNALCKMSAETFKNFMKCLHRCNGCASFAVMLAAERLEWKHVVKTIRRKQVVLHKGGMGIFFKALSVHAWGCAAVILDNLIRAGPHHCPELDSIGISIKTDRHFFRFRMSYLGKVHKSAHDCRSSAILSFMSACWRLHLPVAGAVMAMWHSKWSAARRFMAQPMNQGSAERLLVMMMSDSISNNACVWMSALYVLKAHPDPKLVSTVVIRAAEACSDDTDVHCRSVVAQLLDAVLEEATAQCVLNHIIRNKQLQLLQLCLAKNVHRLAQYRSLSYPSLLHHVIACVAGIPIMVNNTFRLVLTSAAEHLEVRKMLKLCIEAGLTTLVTSHASLSNSCGMTVTPLQMLVCSNSFDMLELLRQTGAVSNHDLFSITTDTLINDHMEGHRLYAERSYLQHAAGSVRSLKDLSVLALSNSIGCDADRKQRALGLPLPLALINKVLFYDVLYESDPIAGTSHSIHVIYKFGTLC